MLGFSLARLQYLDVGGIFREAVSGEWFWYRQSHYRIGITLHLATVVPCGLLMVWQFVPKIRHKVLIVHRINGYVIIILVILSNVGALMIARRAFGGTLATQAGVGVLVISTIIVSLSVEISNIEVTNRPLRQYSWLITTSSASRLINIERGCCAQCFILEPSSPFGSY